MATRSREKAPFLPSSYHCNLYLAGRLEEIEQQHLQALRLGATWLFLWPRLFPLLCGLVSGLLPCGSGRSWAVSFGLQCALSAGAVLCPRLVLRVRFFSVPSITAVWFSSSSEPCPSHKQAPHLSPLKGIPRHLADSS